MTNQAKQGDSGSNLSLAADPSPIAGSSSKDDAWQVRKLGNWCSNPVNQPKGCTELPAAGRFWKIDALSQEWVLFVVEVLIIIKTRTFARIHDTSSNKSANRFWSTRSLEQYWGPEPAMLLCTSTLLGVPKSQSLGLRIMKSARVQFSKPI